MRSSELDYELPQELIAQQPLERRDSSRLLVHDRATGETRHRRFDDLPAELPEGTLVVVNDTRVLPARLRLERPGGGAAEVLLLEQLGENRTWEGLARPSRKLRLGQRLGPVELLEPLGEGRWRLRLEGPPAGEAPLPPCSSARGRRSRSWRRLRPSSRRRSRRRSSTPSARACASRFARWGATSPRSAG
ncbi:MAG TPA: S-adenosylmethionine:tRNA ribosyltransferase-isomerase [Gaiellaceae bacterium]|nr:S-adenosylmethionine:tRNA ribosyltransferase-isomerase [Gaiellaceae bacterium]